MRCSANCDRGRGIEECAALGLTLVEQGDAVVGEGGLELHGGLRSSMDAAADSGFVSSGGEGLVVGRAAQPCLRLVDFDAPLGGFACSVGELVAGRSFFFGTCGPYTFGLASSKKPWALCLRTFSTKWAGLCFSEMGLILREILQRHLS